MRVNATHTYWACFSGVLPAASGLLHFTGIGLGSLLFSLLLISTGSVYGQQTRIQVINLSTDTNLSTVDVYLNTIKQFEDIPTETATPFINVSPGSTLLLSAAPGISNTHTEALLSATVFLSPDKSYVVALHGDNGTAGYPIQFSIDSSAYATSPDTSRVGVGFCHFAQGQEAINIVLRDGPMIVSNLGFGQFAPGVTLPDTEHYLDVKYTDGLANLIGTYRLSLQSYKGDALKVVALTSNIPFTPALRFVAVRTDGFTFSLDVAPLAKVQYINASPDTVDVFKNGTRFSDNAAQGTAMPYKNIPAELPINIGVSPYLNTAVNVPLPPHGNFSFTFENMKKYAAVTTRGQANQSEPMSMFFAEGFRETANDTNKVDLRVFNASKQYASLTLVTGADTLAAALPFGNFSDYKTLPPVLHTFVVKDDAGTVVRSCAFDLAAYKGLSLNITLIPETQGIGIGVAKPDGQTARMCDASSVTTINTLDNIRLMPNPSSDRVRVTAKLATPRLGLSIISPEGRLLLHQDFENPGPDFDHSLDISRCPAGIYFIRIINGQGQSFTSKLQIIR
jgi:hypothetical protein